jgi:spermidine/putrescine ABC transporter ATP-binding subunit
MMSSVQLKGITKEFGSVVAVKSVDLEIQEGEFLTLLGPSGCGKTTTLRLIAGFIEATRGAIILGEEDVTYVPPQNREIGMVFQDYALFPHMSIAENIGFGLKVRKVPTPDIDKRVNELLELVQLPDVGDRYPSEISGGQAQRIAVARAVAFAPKLLLMDEPLGALDLKLRELMQIELRGLQQELGITTIYVTHDQTEAMSMSDRIAVMKNGEIEQLDTAKRIYNNPLTKFVADFVGKINLIDGKVVETVGETATIEANESRFRVPSSDATVVGSMLAIGIRPEHITLVPEGEEINGRNAIVGTVTNQFFAGNILRTDVDIGMPNSIVVESRPSDGIAELGSRMMMTWNPVDCVSLAK